MMVQAFPCAYVVTGVLVLVVGFGFHWMGQVFSLLSWDKATRIGLQEEALLPEYKVYEHALAVADAAIGWIYGVAGVGLILSAEWGFRLAWAPGIMLVYHGIAAWVWEGSRRASGHGMWSDTMRIAWCAANVLTGSLSILAALMH